MNSLITHNQQISILVLLSRVKEGAFRFLIICTLCYNQSGNWKVSSIEELPFYASEFGYRGNNFSKVTRFTILNGVRVDTYCFPGSAAITKDTALVKFYQGISRRMTIRRPYLGAPAHVRIFWPRTRNSWTGKTARRRPDFTLHFLKLEMTWSSR